MSIRAFVHCIFVVITFLGALSCVGLIFGEWFEVWPKNEYWPWIYLLWGSGNVYAFRSSVNSLIETLAEDSGPPWSVR